MMLGLSLALTSPVVLRRTTSPLAIILSWPEIIAWWDSAYGMSLSGAQVTAWADRKHGFAAVQDMASQRPTFGATSFGGAPGIGLDGADDRLVCTDPALLALLPAGNAAGEILTVAQQNAPPADTTQRVAASYGANAFDSQRRVRRTVASSVNRATAQTGAGGGVAPTPTDNTVDLSSRHLLRGRFGGGIVAIEVDGGAATSNSGIVSATGVTRFVIGATAADFPGNFWQGPMRAVVPVAGVLPPDKKAFILETLLNWRNL